MSDAAAWVERLGLRQHPEGGYFRETYRAAERAGERAASTAIYFLLEGEDFSALHSLKQDELWHFYAGSSLTIHIIDPNGNCGAMRLGTNVAAGEEPQAVVPAGWLMGAAVNETNSYALVGCTAAPGFEFADFHMPSREELLARFPQHAELIRRLTRV